MNSSKHTEYKEHKEHKKYMEYKDLDFEDKNLAQYAKYYQGIRRQIHAHPELSFEEAQTSQLIITELLKIGIAPSSIHQNIAKTGVVVEIQKNKNDPKNTQNTKKIMLRADMDALPLQELNHFEHASKNTGKMHACGHDGHVATLLCAVAYIYHHLDFSGTLYAVFQPAEEHGGGAQKMIEAGLFEKFPTDFVFALHNWPNLEQGVAGIQAKALMASSNEFNVKIKGRGGHAAIPDQAADPLLASAHIIQSLQSIVARNVAPLDSAVLSVTYIRGGHASNIIPDEVEFGGTVRTFNTAVTDLIEKRLKQLINSQATSFDCQAEITFSRNYPPTVNHRSAYDLLKNTLNHHKHRYIDDITPTMGAEDFAFMLQKKAWAYSGKC
jgi:amidohydrolase